MTDLVAELQHLLRAREPKGPLQFNAWTKVCPASLLLWAARWLADHPDGESIVQSTNEAWIREVIEAIRLGSKGHGDGDDSQARRR